MHSHPHMQAVSQRLGASIARLDTVINALSPPARVVIERRGFFDPERELPVDDTGEGIDPSLRA